jgi:prepilin-type processing-associated H-X9-DG protein
MCQSRRGGLTLIEVLVIVAIIAILVALLVPSTRRVREAAAIEQCKNNLKQVMLGLHSYADNGRPAASDSPGNLNAAAGKCFPPGCMGPGTNPEERLSWMVVVLPYVDQGPLFTQFDTAKGYAANLEPAQTSLPVLFCPSSTEARNTVTHYIAMAGVGLDSPGRPVNAQGNGFMGYDRLTSLSMIKDGAAHTIALMETRSDLGPWARGGTSTVRGFDPAAALVGANPPFGGHDDRMNVAMADGSVRTIRTSIESGKLTAAITIAGGDQADLD